MSTDIRKKILLATPLYPPDIGGPATYTVMLERFLPSCGFDLVTAPFTSYRRFPKGIRHFLYGVKLFFNAWSVETIFALDPVSVGFPAMVISVLLRKKFILKVVGDYAWEQGSRAGTITATLDEYLHTPFAYGWRTYFRARLERVVAYRAVTIVVPSEYLRTVILTWGVEKDRIVVIPNVATVMRPKEDKKELQKILGIGSCTLLTAGRLVPWKQFDHIIRVMPELLKKFPQLELCIAGDGPDAERLTTLVDSLGLIEHVHLLGRLSTSDLHRYMVTSRAFILVSTYEGLSHLLIEALTLGTPIITSNAGGNAEVVQRGRCGYLVPLDDDSALIRAIETICNNGEEVSRRVSEGLRSAERYTPTAHLSLLSSYL